ncbi:hypothetical protein DSUL_20091 [Desulfovibrionales bacterium]
MADITLTFRSFFVVLTVGLSLVNFCNACVYSHMKQVHCCLSF